jgi:hypothetical protein
MNDKRLNAGSGTMQQSGNLTMLFQPKFNLASFPVIPIFASAEK